MKPLYIFRIRVLRKIKRCRSRINLPVGTRTVKVIRVYPHGGKMCFSGLWRKSDKLLHAQHHIIRISVFVAKLSDFISRKHPYVTVFYLYLLAGRIGVRIFMPCTYQHLVSSPVDRMQRQYFVLVRLYRIQNGIMIQIQILAKTYGLLRNIGCIVFNICIFLCVKGTLIYFYGIGSVSKFDTIISNFYENIIGFFRCPCNRIALFFKCSAKRNIIILPPNSSCHRQKCHHTYNNTRYFFLHNSLSLGYSCFCCI